ncbi:MAG TPA: glutathione S-transferase family protein [Rhodopila sp.]|uniref:glutathione S-transferase family protein n=1 Tax=Rhodopila sp. TaxID=2480087 RepID=UPI002C0D58B2|nr:glutathione S-transferase family protein [Rhodopila sp.]HVY14810.1 glutathione S-transferase family protein [Rhodopila sp.]
MSGKTERILWGRATSSNVMKALWVLEELGLPYRRVDVGGAFGKTDTPEYRAMNPTGLVPTLQEGDFTLWESNAIVRYLARDAASIWPADPRGRATVDHWMDAQQTTMNRPMAQVFWGLVRTPADKRDLKAVAAAIEETAKAWRYVETEVSKHAYLAGDSFTICDIPWGVHAHRWFNIDYMGLVRPDMPALKAWYDRLCQRPAYQRAVTATPIS